MAHLFNKNPDNKYLPTGYYYTHSYGTYRSSNEISRDLVVQFNEALHDPNQTVYVGYGEEGKARYGSIGIAVPKGYDPNNRASWPTSRASAAAVLSGRGGYRDYIQRDEMDIHWDSKHSMTASNYESGLYWLTTHPGPTNWVFTRKAKTEKPKVVALDKLENEVEVGDFVVFVGRSSYSTSKGDLMFGFVEKVSPAGIMTCKNIKLSDSDYVREWRVGKGDQITKMSADILKQLMLRRLSF